MAEGIVDDLESVDIEANHRQFDTDVAVHGQGVIEPLEKQQAVGQFREDVVIG